MVKIDTPLPKGVGRSSVKVVGGTHSTIEVLDLVAHPPPRKKITPPRSMKFAKTIINFNKMV